MYVVANSIGDAFMIDFDIQNGRKIDAKSVPKRSQKVCKRVLNEDGISKRTKVAARFISTPPGDLKVNISGARRGRETGWGQTTMSSHAGQPLDKPRDRRIFETA